VTEGANGPDLDTLAGLGRGETRPMRATPGEFHYRFWIVTALFFAAFGCYGIDHQNSAVALAHYLQSSLFPSLAFPTLLHAVFGLGTVLVALGALMRTWAGAYLLSSVVHDTELHTEGLVADGPFRYLRNPLYLGLLLLAAGFGLGASRIGWVVLVGGLIFFTLRLIGREEHELLANQGRAYGDYLAAVPALVPSLRPRVAGSGRAPAWGQAFLGELHMWIFTLVTLALTITLDGRVLAWGALGAILPYTMIQRALQMRSHLADRGGNTGV
jgi:protein-S-isoprenylcysteine O-methyltransferase Ste14